VEYTSGVQLDLVLMPALERQGIPDGDLAIVDGVALRPGAGGKST
jgi:hypothetical protein